MQATETSTAVRHDVEAMAKIVTKRRTNALLVVDGITGLGTTHFDVDGWGIDVLIGGSQKAVMIPPGLAYLSVSERAWAAMETVEESALLLRPAQGAQERRQGRERVHAGRGADCRPGRGARLHCRAGGRRSRKGPHRAGRQRAGERGGNARRARVAGLHAVCAHGSGGGGHGGCGAGGHGLGRRGQGAQEPKFALVTANGQGEMQGKIFRVAHLGFFDYLDTIALSAQWSTSPRTRSGCR